MASVFIFDGGAVAPEKQMSSPFHNWTTADVERHNARVAKTPLPDDVQGMGEPVGRERDLHEHIRAYCAVRGWLAFHGSMAHRTFRIEGEPDWVILANDSRFFLIECKTKTGKLSTEQQGIALWAAKLGHVVYVVRSMDDFLTAVGEQPPKP